MAELLWFTQTGATLGALGGNEIHQGPLIKGKSLEKVNARQKKMTYFCFHHFFIL